MNPTDHRTAVFEAVASHPASHLPAHVKPLARPQPLVRAQALAFLIFDKPDLARMEAFLGDFGMALAERTAGRLVMRGTDARAAIYVARQARRARYVGAAFEVPEDTDFDRLAAQAGGRALAADEIPGEGRGIALRDPAGHEVWLIAGQRRPEPLAAAAAPPPPVNAPGAARRVNGVVRTPLQPAQVVKTGHVVLRATRFELVARWYMRHLGLVPTDVQYLEDGSPNLAFLRLDLGDQPADHHSVVIAGALDDGYEHSAYEVRDLESLGQGQQVLKSAGHRHLWGIGRHVLGSQLFDYWFDPDGAAMEHYADGDLFTADYETHYTPLHLSGLYAWGADLPRAMRPERSLGTLLRAIGLLRRGELSLRRLQLLGRAFDAPARPWL